MSIDVKVSGAVAYLQGSMDDRADYSPLLSMKPPLKLNLVGVKSMNSHGIRHWIKFLTEWGSRPMEFYECPPVFLDAVNLVPQIASLSGNPETIKSVSVPFHCTRCNRATCYEMAISEIQIQGHHVTIPQKQCKTCGEMLGPETDPDDLFLFLTEPA